MVVGLGDEAGVDLHLPGVHPLGVVAERVPGGHVGIPLGQLGALGDQAQCHLALEHDAPVLVPPHVEAPAVAVDPLLLHLVRGMARAGREPQEERLLGRVHVGVLHEPDRAVRQVDVQVVALLRRGGRAHPVVVVDEVGVPLVGVTAEEPVEAFEAAAERPAVERPGRRGLVRRGEVPLADAEGAVPVGQQHLGEEAVLVAHRRVHRRVAERQLGDRCEAQGVVVAAGEEAPTGGRAERGGLEVRVPQALLGEAIEVRRLTQPSVRGQLAVAHVVEHDDHHVRCSLGRCGAPRPRRGRRLQRPADHPREGLARGVGLERFGHRCPPRLARSSVPEP